MVSDLAKVKTKSERTEKFWRKIKIAKMLVLNRREGDLAEIGDLKVKNRAKKKCDLQ